MSNLTAVTGTTPIIAPTTTKAAAAAAPAAAAPETAKTAAPAGDSNAIASGGDKSALKLDQSKPVMQAAQADPLPEVLAKGLSFKSWGDPHEVSGDGLKFDNWKTGTFTALQSKSGDLVLEKKQEHVENTGADGSTVNTEAALKVGSDLIKYTAGTDKLNVNDKDITLKDGESLTLPDGGTLSRKGNNYTVNTPKGDTITVQDKGKYLDFEGQLSAKRGDGEVTGSLGRFDADTDATNDLVKADGTIAKNVEEFLGNWQTNATNSLFNKKAADVSPYAKELSDLKASNAELFKQEQALGDERRPLLVDVGKEKPIYDALKALPADQVTEGDVKFMKDFEAKSAKVEDLNNKIQDLNERQAAQATRIGALEKIVGLESKNKELFATEQEKGKERMPILAEVSEKKPQYDGIKDLPATLHTEGDQSFIKHFDTLNTSLTVFNDSIRKLNEDQDANRKEIERLDAESKLKAATKAPAAPAAAAAAPAAAPVQGATIGSAS